MPRPQELKITFQPSGRTLYVLPGTTLLEAAARGGLVLQTPCGGGGTCGKCLVRVQEGRTTDSQEAHRLTAAQRAEGWRLACATRVESDAVVQIPATSMFEATQRILTRDSGHRIDVEPALTSPVHRLPPPTREDAISDVARLERAAGHALDFDRKTLARLPHILRGANWNVHLLLDGRRVLDVQPEADRSVPLGVAFDLGTTTVVGTLLDLATGEERALASTLNGQIPFGDDVLARILRIRENAANLDVLQQAAAGSLNEIVADLCRQAGVPASRILAATLAGNTTMQQVVCGIDPSALGELPFVPAFTRGFSLRAGDMGLRIHESARLHVFPQVGGFVGGDTVAGMLAAGFDRLDKPTLLVDIGTNGEIALFFDGQVLCASTAAGPAFEGARIGQGMRATSGAIEKVLVEQGRLLINVIGNAPPAGLCGTALIDAVAELLRHGVLEETGRIRAPDELPPTVADDLRQRVICDGDQPRFVLAWANGEGSEVSLGQRDIRELQLASGAIRAGIETLMRRAGVTTSDVDAVLLAGAFGNFIRRSNAQRIGLLPPLPHDRVRFIGNASSMGAKMALLSTSARARAESLATTAHHVDLSTDPDFQMAFGMAMMFPEEV